MKTELSCHLVDLTSLENSPVSLALGYLQSFAQADSRLAERCTFSSECRHLDDGLESTWKGIQEIIEGKTAEKHVFAFTNYFWNRQLNLILADRIKALSPEALVVFGGNDVTDQGQTLLGSSPQVDIVVNGEGEVVFANVLATHLDNARFQEVSGISFRDEDGGILTTAPQPRIEVLDSIPSPFLSGVYSREAMASSRQVVYEFSRGCPFKCAFCFWGAAVGTKTRRFSQERIRQDLEFIVLHTPNFCSIVLADANFGMVEADVELSHFLASLIQKHKKQIFWSATGWAKNSNSRVVRTAKALFQNGMIGGVSLAAQSVNTEVLRIAERTNIPFEYYRKLQQEFHGAGIPTYTDLIFGLPGESYESFRDGVQRVIEAGGSPVIYPLLLLNGTEYSEARKREQYQIESRKMPYRYRSTNLANVEIVVGHAQLRYEDWLKGMGLGLVVSFFYSGILKFMITQLHAVHHLSYGEMFDCLVDHCMRGEMHSHELFQKVFLNYIATWDAVENYDRALMEKVMTDGPYEHNRALWTIVTQDSLGADALVTELSTIMAQLVGKGLSPDFVSWLDYQKLLVRAITQVARCSAGEVHTTLEKSRLRAYAGGDIADEAPDGTRRLQVRQSYRCFNLDMLDYRILYGNLDTLKMFERRDPSQESTTNPSRVSSASSA